MTTANGDDASSDTINGYNESGLPAYSEEELQSMSNSELEQICLVRGFEVVQDDVDETTGTVISLSHDDFVEAAKKCLAIEREM